MINENAKSLKNLFDLIALLKNEEEININDYDLTNNILLEKIAGQLIEYIIFKKIEKLPQFDNIKYTPNDIWDFTGKLNSSNLKIDDQLPVDKELKFEVKSYKDGNVHNITLTESQRKNINLEDLYFILIDYSIVSSKIKINEFYLIDNKSMNSILGSKSVKKSLFDKIIKL